MILALETATSACSAAVVAVDGTLIAQLVEDEGPAHLQRLLPFVHEVLQVAGVELGDLDAVVCGLGPGAYTGMRIGVATARALAQAGGLGLGGAPTLNAVALALASDAQPGVPLVALLDGKRRELFAGVFRMDRRIAGTAAHGVSASGVIAHEAPPLDLASRGAALSSVAPLAVVPAADLAEYLEQWPGATVGGDGALMYAERLSSGVTLAVDTAPPTAAMVGRAWLAGVPGSVEGFTEVLPVYGRAPDATHWQGRGTR